MSVVAKTIRLACRIFGCLNMANCLSSCWGAASGPYDLAWFWRPVALLIDRSGMTRQRPLAR